MEYKAYMTIKTMLLALTLSLFSCSTFAQIYDGSDLSQIELNQVIERIQPGTVLVVGEMHGLKSVHDQQMSILKALRNSGLKVSVGMEFFNYTDQSTIEKFRKGEISEEEFQKAVQWGGMDFNLYGPQLLFGEYGLGINMPRSVTSQISKNGLASLTLDQQKLMPPEFELGNNNYKRRFNEVMGQHVPQMKLDNYFAAQCVWDDTMAWQTTEFMNQHPDHVFVITVGEFHAAYGGGLPDRLQKRGIKQIKTISQIYTEGMTDEEILTAVAPTVLDGKRADFIFLAHPSAPRFQRQNRSLSSSY